MKYFIYVTNIIQFSCSVVSDSLRPHELQHARPPCPSPTLEFTQTHGHRVSDTIQPSHPLSSPSLPTPNPSQHQGLFQWVNSSHEVAKVLGVSSPATVLPRNTQDWSPLDQTNIIVILKYSIWYKWKFIEFLTQVIKDWKKYTKYVYTHIERLGSCNILIIYDIATIGNVYSIYIWD